MRKAILLTLGFLLAACAPAAPLPLPRATIAPSATAAPTPTAVPPTALPATAAPAPTRALSTKAAPAGATEPFLIYTLSGGISGRSESWQLYSDGRLVSNAGKELRAAPAAASALLSELRAADFPAPEQSKPGSTCADCFTVVLEFNDGGKSSRLSVVLESKDAEAAALSLVQTVQAYIKQAK